MKINIKDWLLVSIDDLTASKLLYQNGRYRSSFLLFQQASEKANKALGFYSDILDYKSAKRVFHDQIAIYSEMIKKNQMELNKKVAAIKPLFYAFNQNKFKKRASSYEQDLSNIYNELIEFKKIEPFGISAAKLNSFLRDLNKVHDLTIDPELIDKEKFLITLIKSLEKMSDVLNISDKDLADFKHSLKDKEREDEIFNLFVNELFPLMIDIIIIYFTMCCCAFITNHHAVKTRYPDDKHNPIQAYTLKLPIVRKQCEFMELLEIAIYKLMSLVEKEAGS